MFEKLFGKAGKSAAADGPQRPGQAVPLSEYSWTGDVASAAACNWALGHLASNLPIMLAKDGHTHAETYVAAAGAIAGFAAQRTLFENSTPAASQSISAVKTRDGSTYWFGDELNFMLIARTQADAGTRVWSVASGGAHAAGLPVDQIPDVGRMFAHVASSIGGEHEGLPSVAPKHRPLLPGRELLKQVWPIALTCFSGSLPGAKREYGSAPLKWWSAIAARASARPIIDVKGVLPPALALTILMETAIYASKLDRAVIEQG